MFDDRNGPTGQRGGHWLTAGAGMMPPLRIAFGAVQAARETPAIGEFVAGAARAFAPDTHRTGATRPLPEVTALLRACRSAWFAGGAAAAAWWQPGVPAGVAGSAAVAGEQALVRPNFRTLAPGIDAVVTRRIDPLDGAGARTGAAGRGGGRARCGPALAAQVLGCGGDRRHLRVNSNSARRCMAAGSCTTRSPRRCCAVRSPADAERLHRGVAGALESQGADAALVAGHWRACGEWLRMAGRAGVAAAAQAQRAGRTVERCQWLDSAAECPESVPTRTTKPFDVISQRPGWLSARDRAASRGADRPPEALARTPGRSCAPCRKGGLARRQRSPESFEMGRLGMGAGIRAGPA